MQEREQLTAELGKAHALVEETAADRLEATELLSRAVCIMESMRDHMSTERQAMWQCFLQMLHLQPDAPPAQASTAFARCLMLLCTCCISLMQRAAVNDIHGLALLSSGGVGHGWTNGLGLGEKSLSPHRR